MPNYAAELVESVLHDHEYTDKPLRQIAAEHGVNERDITRMRHANGIPSRRARLRALSPGMREMHEINKRLKEARPPAAADAEVARNTQGDAGRTAGNDADEPELRALVARVARLIEHELAAEEATRAKLGMFARTPTEAERCARIVASMTRSLRELLRLRAGLPLEQGSHNDHDLPADADDARNELARRIAAFLESREADGGAECAAGAAIVAR